MATRGVDALISDLLVKAGITEVRPLSEMQILGKMHSGQERKAVHRAYGLRKSLLTALTENGVDPMYLKC